MPRLPVPPYFGKLTSAKVVVPTIAGDVRIAWHRRGREINLEVKAPKSVTVLFTPVSKKEKINFRLKALS